MGRQREGTKNIRRDRERDFEAFLSSLSNGHILPPPFPPSHLSTMRFLLEPLLLLSLPILISAQTCLQYAPTSGSECDCPPGFAGTDCSLPVCGASLFAGTGSGRALAPSNGSVENCACDDGWGGSGCTGESLNGREGRES